MESSIERGPTGISLPRSLASETTGEQALLEQSSNVRFVKGSEGPSLPKRSPPDRGDLPMPKSKTSEDSGAEPSDVRLDALTYTAQRLRRPSCLTRMPAV